MNATSRARPTVAEIDLAALRANYRVIRELVGGAVKIVSVVKANAYGHGAISVARVLEAAGSDALGVSTVEEGVELRRAGISSPVIVLGGFLPGEAAAVVANRLTPVVWSEEMLAALAGESRRCRVHLKVDTGMSRLGVPVGEVGAFLASLRRYPGLVLEGVCSHLATADSPHSSMVREQVARFRSVLAAVAAAGHDPPWKHIANSAATLACPEAHFTAVRPGLVLYGIPPGPGLGGSGLRPVMTFKTAILQLRQLATGVPVSYGQTFVTSRPTEVATLPVGYADGYSRALSNRARTVVRNRRVPVIGRVCMDHTMVDVTDVPGAEVGDEVELWGQRLSVDEVAGWGHTISYELLSGVGMRVPRRRVGGD